MRRCRQRAGDGLAYLGVPSPPRPGRCMTKPLATGYNRQAGKVATERRGSGEEIVGDMAHSVLIVEDEKNIVLSLEFLMRKAGYKVVVARDGDAALAAVVETTPDLVLLDVMLPKRNGYQVCEAIRGNPELADVKIIMLTAKGRDAERAKGIALGANEYITKPFSTREVVDTVRQLLDGGAS